MPTSPVPNNRRTVAKWCPKALSKGSRNTKRQSSQAQCPLYEKRLKGPFVKLHELKLKDLIKQSKDGPIRLFPTDKQFKVRPYRRQGRL